MFGFGIDLLLADPPGWLRTARIGLVAHPASVTSTGVHTVDALVGAGANIVRTFGPQHGMRGDVQDNMIESSDYIDPTHGMPVISLYGEHRRPTSEMLEGLDVILFDLQDIGCRIYTYISTLHYFLEACAGTDIGLFVLDRPNPAGRPVDGLALVPGEESFVGCAPLPVRHGLTVGELALWFRDYRGLDVEPHVIRMTGFLPDASPGYGWPVNERAWVNPSPNAASLNMARCFPGTVLLEGTELSEGRGTTVPLEIIGAPDLPAQAMLAMLQDIAPEWCDGIMIRPCYFEPTFHKHVGRLCHGLQFHTDHELYEHDRFRPFLLIAGLLRALRELVPDYEIWRYHEYEYEFDRIPIDVINGGPGLRTWVDDPEASHDALREQVDADCAAWLTAREPFILYK